MIGSERNGRATKKSKKSLPEPAKLVEATADLPNEAFTWKALRCWVKCNASDGEAVLPLEVKGLAKWGDLAERRSYTTETLDRYLVKPDSGENGLPGLVVANPGSVSVETPLGNPFAVALNNMQFPLEPSSGSGQNIHMLNPLTMLCEMYKGFKENQQAQLQIKNWKEDVPVVRVKQASR